MRYRCLKHKTLEDTFGVFHDYLDDGTQYGIAHCTKPDLFGETTTLETLKEYWKDYPAVIRQLDDYDIIDAELSFPYRNTVDVNNLQFGAPFRLEGYNLPIHFKRVDDDGLFIFEDVYGDVMSYTEEQFRRLKPC